MLFGLLDHRRKAIEFLTVYYRRAQQGSTKTIPEFHGRIPVTMDYWVDGSVGWKPRDQRLLSASVKMRCERTIGDEKSTQTVILIDALKKLP